MDGHPARLQRVPANQKFETFLEEGVLLEKFHLFTVQLRHFAGEVVMPALMYSLSRSSLDKSLFRMGVDQGKALAVVDPLGSPEHEQETTSQPAVLAQPPGDEGLFVEGEFGSPLGLHLRRSHAALSTKLDRPVALAATQAHGETSTDVARSTDFSISAKGMAVGKSPIRIARRWMRQCLTAQTYSPSSVR